MYKLLTNEFNEVGVYSETAIRFTKRRFTRNGSIVHLLNVVIDVIDVSMLRIEYMSVRWRVMPGYVDAIVYRIEIMGKKNAVKWSTMTTGD